MAEDFRNREINIPYYSAKERDYAVVVEYVIDPDIGTELTPEQFNDVKLYGATLLAIIL